MTYKFCRFCLSFMVLGLFCAVPPAQASDITDPMECADYDGRWSRFGNNDEFSCSLPTMDGGASCESSEDCETVCITEDDIATGTHIIGHCYDWTVLNGTCMNYVEGGVAQGQRCVE